MEKRRKRRQDLKKNAQKGENVSSSSDENDDSDEESDEDEEDESSKRKTAQNREFHLKRMQSYRDAYLEREIKEESSYDEILKNLSERLENMNTSRIEDREFFEGKLKTIEHLLNQINTKSK